MRFILGIAEHEPHGAVRIVDMKEDVVGRAVLSNGWLPLSLRPNEIVTATFDYA